jgi:hypothetical protein
MDGLSESNGEVDGIARAAKVSFVDLGVSGKLRLNCVDAACASSILIFESLHLPSLKQVKLC